MELRLLAAEAVRRSATRKILAGSAGVLMADMIGGGAQGDIGRKYKLS